MSHSNPPEPQASQPGYPPALQAARVALLQARTLAGGQDEERVAWLVRCVDHLVDAGLAAQAGRQPETAGELQEGDEVDQVVLRRTITHTVQRVAPGPFGVVTVYFSETFRWVLPVGRPVRARRPHQAAEHGERGEAAEMQADLDRVMAAVEDEHTSTEDQIQMWREALSVASRRWPEVDWSAL